MARPSKNDDRSDKSETEREQKRYRLELSPGQLFFCLLGLIVVLSWMFAFGALVGRGRPMVSSKDFSLRAELIRFLGLGKQAAPPPEDAASTWDDPKKMLEALNYYEDLTQKAPSTGASPSAQNPAKSASTFAAQKKASLEPMVLPQNPLQAQSQPQSPNRSAKPSAAAETEKAAKPEQPKAAPKKALAEAAPPDSGSEHFTLLVASLRDTEQAQHLVEKLRSKGYASRLEALNLSDNGHWNRVLVGSFKNREEALRFSADFNRKERMEALVIREVN